MLPLCLLHPYQSMVLHMYTMNPGISHQLVWEWLTLGSHYPCPDANSQPIASVTTCIDWNFPISVLSNTSKTDMIGVRYTIKVSAQFFELQSLPGVLQTAISLNWGEVPWLPALLKAAVRFLRRGKLKFPDLENRLYCFLSNPDWMWRGRGLPTSALIHRWYIHGHNSQSWRPLHLREWQGKLVCNGRDEKCCMWNSFCYQYWYLKGYIYNIR